MTAELTFTRDRLKAGLPTLAIHLLLVVALLAGLGAGPAALRPEAIRLIDLAPPPPPPAVVTIPPVRERSRRPEGAASPPNLESRRTDIVAPEPVLPPPPQSVIAADRADHRRRPVGRRSGHPRPRHRQRRDRQRHGQRRPRQRAGRRRRRRRRRRRPDPAPPHPGQDQGPRLSARRRRGRHRRHGLGDLRRRAGRPRHPLRDHPVQRQPGARFDHLPPDRAALPLPALARPRRPAGPLADRPGPLLGNPRRSAGGRAPGPAAALGPCSGGARSEGFGHLRARPLRLPDLPGDLGHPFHMRELRDLEIQPQYFQLVLENIPNRQHHCSDNQDHQS